MVDLYLGGLGMQIQYFPVKFIGVMLRDMTLLFNVDRSKRLAVRILQLGHPSGSLLNLNQEMAELFKKIVLFFFCVDEGSTPVFQPRTQT